MKTIIITDQSTNIKQDLSQRNKLFTINNSVSPINQITNSIANLLSSGFDIVYLSSQSFFEKLSNNFEKLCNNPPNSKIIIIKNDSKKSNLIKKILDTDSIIDVVLKYNLKYETFFGDVCFDEVAISELGASILI